MAQTANFDLSTPSAGISRRTVVKGAAWSVPVIAFAGAAPAFAGASQCTSIDNLVRTPTTQVTFDNTWSGSGANSDAARLAAVQSAGGTYLIALRNPDSSGTFSVSFDWLGVLEGVNANGVCSVTVVVDAGLTQSGGGTNTLTITAGAPSQSHTLTVASGYSPYSLVTTPTLPTSVTVNAQQTGGTTSSTFLVDFVRVEVDYW